MSYHVAVLQKPTLGTGKCLQCENPVNARIDYVVKYCSPMCANQARTRHPLQRFSDAVVPEPNSGCWLWTLRLNKTGYGVLRVGASKVLAHRFAYMNLVGEIPEGLHIDHLCRNPACVNPKHLEPVTPRENAMRGISFSAVNAHKTHCVQGHPFDEANTYVRRDRGQARECRPCNRAAVGRLRQQKALEAAP